MKWLKTCGALLLAGSVLAGCAEEKTTTEKSEEENI
ncbi:hypothetical protein LR68_04447 [Anoxybacillus sp. BCO1]|nr:hypothetical protein LR68_04447 [Anoxybacillus sp. BCO1]